MKKNFLKEHKPEALKRVLGFLSLVGKDVPFALFHTNVNTPDSEVKILLGIGEQNNLSSTSLEQLETKDSWQMYLLPYEVNHNHFGLTQSQEILGFEPEWVVEFGEEGWSELKTNNSWKTKFLETKNAFQSTNQTFIFEPSEGKETYIKQFNRILDYIKRGDIYELNYCFQWIAKFTEIDIVKLYHQLNEKTKSSFSGMFRHQGKVVLSASPERFFKKEKTKLISQPIKGTAKRFLDSSTLDEKSKQSLLDSEKEKSENLMIVDLVRNDMSQISNRVSYPRLLEIQSYPTVHQMVSTIEGEIDECLPLKNILKALAPMGSMTGVPKPNALKITKELESLPRGYYSGSMGYVTPKNEMNFNVIIRSYEIDLEQKKIRVGVGSAVTVYANAEQEYEECLLKAKALLS